jgi:hypothetical protein
VTTKSNDIDLTAPELREAALTPMEKRWLYENFDRIKTIISVLDAGQGVNGTFVVGPKTYTITNGVITSIV